MFTQRGASLIESLTCVSVLAILAFLAVPSFANLTYDAAVSANHDALLRNMNMAKHKAITSGAHVTLCAKKAGADECATQPTSDAWNNGWLVFINNNTNTNTFDLEDTLIADIAKNENPYSAIYTSPAGKTALRIVYNSSGTATKTSGSLFTCNTKTNQIERKIDLYLSGIAYSTPQGKRESGTCSF